MNIRVTDEFVEISKKIIDENKSNEDWAGVESDDMFQTESFCGGYDADEEEFCFSYYDSDGSEYWFQLSLEDIEKVVGGEMVVIDCRPAE